MRKDIVILSGKGGTGKTTVTVNLSLFGKSKGKKVGLLDCDINTPNIPKMFGMGKVRLIADQIVEPVDVNGLKVFSVGFDAEEKQCILWDGMLVSSVVRECMEGINWGELDYLFIDLPPGTVEEILTLIKYLKNPSAIVVIIPTPTGELDARKTLSLLENAKIPTTGIIENFSGLFGDGVGERLAKEYNTKLLGKIKFNKSVIIDLEKGENTSLLSSDDFIPIAESVIC